MPLENMKIHPFNEQCDLLMAGDEATTLDVCARHFASTCRAAIQSHGSFFVALSGGSTPKAVYERLCNEPYRSQISWDRVHLFWGDERNVGPDDPESNFKMAMEAGFSQMSIPPSQIHRMQGEEPIQEHAAHYNALLERLLRDHPFDLVILGMGEDGHTASLFPQTDALKVQDKLATANYIPQKNTWRMTLTYPAINSASNIVIYVIGSNKQATLNQVLTSEKQIERYPIQSIGTRERKALWILDDQASAGLRDRL